MKLVALQTATEEISLTNNVIYKGILEKFHQLFVRKEAIETPVILRQSVKEGSQFYKTLVALVGTGIRTKATVLYACETGLVINFDPVINVVLRFPLSTNEMIEVSAKTVVPRNAIPQAADMITIAYDSKDLGLVAVL